ncbi:MAG TPA: aldo/keto reductase [Gemmatimonadetes bacterium]|nr:aldo/keto reductase [Gemmatimonadota bacterium]
MKISRREMLKVSAGAGAALMLNEWPAFAQERPLIMRSIPSTGEQIPALGLGSARTLNVGPPSPMWVPLSNVVRLFHEMGGRLFDTAPSYGTSEQVAGQMVQELEIENDLFFATKISTGGGRQAGFDQQEGSLRYWGRDVIDLNQVHNLRDVDIHLRTIRQAKEEGRTRYVGVTTSFDQQYEQMEQVLRSEELDFVQVNYSLGERTAADRLIPLAQDRGIAVIINEPYNVGRLFAVTSGRELPDWAAEFECESWGQFFLKYILGHPAVTAVIPATSDPEHLVDNMGGGRGRLPDEQTRRRMEDLFDQWA